MSSPLRTGQILRGRLGTYNISKSLQDTTVWLAKNNANQDVVVKNVSGHPRVQNERDVLRRFQTRSRYIRQMIDEIEEPSEPITIVLEHLEDHLLQASIKRTLNRKEIKFVSRRVLEALNVLHQDGFVHTDIKSNNVFVNYKDEAEDSIRFSDVKLGDFGGTYPHDSEWAKSGTHVGAPLWNSPEILMDLPWGTPTDIWSFGTLLIHLIYGGDFMLFRPKSSRYEDEDYRVQVWKQQLRYFGPFPPKIEEVLDEETMETVLGLTAMTVGEGVTPFRFISQREVVTEDKEFILRIMKMDWRDRPTAEELLNDEWFSQD